MLLSDFEFTSCTIKIWSRRVRKFVVPKMVKAKYAHPGLVELVDRIDVSFQGPGILKAKDNGRFSCLMRSNKLG